MSYVILMVNRNKMLIEDTQKKVRQESKHVTTKNINETQRKTSQARRKKATTRHTKNKKMAIISLPHQ